MDKKIYENMRKHNKYLSDYACTDDKVIRFEKESEDFRPGFFRDIDRIIYSLSYVRYMDKTQVFTETKNDHIQKRMIHVQYVSKIARTIGRALNLNEDLIEAAALGHDLGHTPFGHVGERVLNEISKEVGEGYFMHNINSVRNLMFVENYGKGQNISLQVLDGIMCHNGELVSNEYYIMSAANSHEAKSYLNSDYRRISVIILSSQIQGESSSDFVKQIKSIPAYKKIPILIFCKNQIDEEAKLCLSSRK